MMRKFFGIFTLSLERLHFSDIFGGGENLEGTLVEALLTPLVLRSKAIQAYYLIYIKSKPYLNRIHLQ